MDKKEICYGMFLLSETVKVLFQKKNAQQMCVIGHKPKSTEKALSTGTSSRISLPQGGVCVCVCVCARTH